MFDEIVHADWSMAPQGRWWAQAVRVDGRWQVDAPQPVPTPGALLARALQSAAKGRRVLLGFDFPIGLPVAYARQTKLPDFLSALQVFGEGEWSRFFTIVNSPAGISVHQPFYPRTPTKGVTQQSLVTGLKVAAFADLLRECEKVQGQRPACSLFWTLGGNQVGRAALHGWQNIVLPGLLDPHVRLWPFHGPLADCAAQPGVVIAETYPAAAGRFLGVSFPPGSKLVQADRQAKGSAIHKWVAQRMVDLSPQALLAVQNGFGTGKCGDKFDAFIGLLGMIEVADGHRCEGPVTRQDVKQWEGWILGQA